jgi:hypothetical protein
MVIDWRKGRERRREKVRKRNREDERRTMGRCEGESRERKGRRE